MALRPLHDRVIVKRRTTSARPPRASSSRTAPLKSRTKAKSSPLARKKTEDGKILPVDLKAGDKVLFGKYAGQSVKVDGEELLVIREDEILAVIQ